MKNKSTTRTDSIKKNEQTGKNYQWLNWVMIAVGACVMLYLRIVPYKKYFMPDIPFKDSDTCYHLRRIIYIATHNMQFPFYDPLLAHPHGAIPIWSPLYDWLSALPAFVLGLGHPSPLFIQQVSMIMTLLFGMSALVVIAILTYKATANWTTALLASLLAGHTGAQLRFASIEIIDHNSLIMLLYALVLLKTYFVFCKNESLDFIKDVVVISVLVALLFWVWSGSYVHVSILALIHFAYAVWSKKDHLFHGFAAAYAMSSILISPLALIHYYLGKELLRFEYISLFTVIYLLLLAGPFFIASILFQWKKSNKKAILAAGLICSAIVIITIMVIISTPIIEGFQFARAQNVWLSTIAESRPLFFQQNGPITLFFWTNAINKLNYLLLLFPAAFLVFLLRYTKIQSGFYIIIAANSLILGYLAWSQQKFVFDFTFFYGIVLSLFIVRVYRKIVNNFSFVVTILFVVCIILLLIPLKKNFKEFYIQINAYYPPFEWLKKELNLKNTEINSGHIQPDGVMAPWDLGHYLHLYSEAPTVTDNFGLNLDPTAGFYDSAKFFLSEDEDKARLILQKYHVSYVVVPLASTYEYYPVFLGLDPQLFYNYKIIEKDRDKYIIAEGKPEFGKTIGYRLSDMWGSTNPYEDEQLFDYPALKHFRLLYASPEAKVAGQKVAEGSLKIYKYVDGTPLSVNVTGNPSYKLEALIRLSSGTAFSYRQKGFVNDGIIAPYPTRRIKDYPYAEYYKIYIDGHTYDFPQVE